MRTKIAGGILAVALGVNGCNSGTEPDDLGSGGTAGTAGRDGAAGAAGRVGGSSGLGGGSGRGGTTAGNSGRAGSAGNAGGEAGASGAGACYVATLWQIDEEPWCVDYSETIEVETCPSTVTGCPTVSACVRRRSDNATFLVGEVQCFLNGIDGWEPCKDTPEENETVDECPAVGAGGAGGNGGEGGV